MGGIADNNTKLALAGGVYFSVAIIVGAGFTMRGAELQAQNDAALVPAPALVKPVAATQSDENNELRKDKDARIGEEVGVNFDPRSLMEPAIELAIKNKFVKSAARRVVF